VKKTVMTVMALALLSAGCNQIAAKLGLGKPPSCSDKETLAIVRSLLAEKFMGAGTLTAQQLETALVINNPLPTKFDESIKKYTCEAGLVLSYKGMVYTLSLEYISQLNDQGDHLAGYSGLNSTDGMIIRAALGETIEAAVKPAAITATTAPVQPAATKQPPIVANSPSALTTTLLSMDGKTPWQVIANPDLKRVFTQLLGASFDDFNHRLQVASAVSREGDWLFGSGLAPHQGGSDEAAFAISTKTGEAFGAMTVGGEKIFMYGTDKAANLPPPLLDWYQEHSGL
jgi:hypothetical protein